MKKICTILLAIAFLYLLAAPGWALQSARDGLLLWYRSVLPVLFPFMLLSSLFLQLDLPETLPAALYRPLRFLFGCSDCVTFAILGGFFCGFPMGAKLTGDLLRQNSISRREAQFLYGFVNNLSPGFILSYIAANQLGCPALGLPLLINISGAALLYGLLTSISFRRQNTVSSPGNDFAAPSDGNIFSIIDDCIYDTIRSTVKLGAYIVLFCILSGAVIHVFSGICSFPVSRFSSLILLSGIEITNGVRLICTSGLSLPAKYILLSMAGAFGGLSALAQTAGIARMDRSLLFQYIKSRVIITLLSIILSVCSVFFRPLFGFLFL